MRCSALMLILMSCTNDMQCLPGCSTITAAPPSPLDLSGNVSALPTDSPCGSLKLPTHSSVQHFPPVQVVQWQLADIREHAL